jgi:hypothetical protein
VGRRPALALTLVIVGGMAALGALDPHLARRLAAEGQPIEWVQVLLLGWAGWICLARACRAAAAGERAPDLLAGLGLWALAVGEMEIPRWLYGRSIKLNVWAGELAAGRPRAVVLVLIVLPAAVGVALYALRHRRALGAWGRQAVLEAPRRLALVGAVLFCGAQAFERPLSHAALLPGTVIEETLELLGAVYMLLGLSDRGAAPEA